MNKLFFILFMTCVVYSAAGQKLYGVVKASDGTPLPYSSISIKNTSKGVSANNLAQYSFTLPAGEYEINCQHIGYETVTKKVTVNDITELNFRLSQQKLTMNNVVISSKENPANAIIREAIKKRKEHNEQTKDFICNLYSKDIIRLKNLPDKIFGQKVPEDDKKVMGLDTTGSGIIYLSESVSKASVSGDKMKLEVNSSRVSGSNSFGFTFPSFISLYSNNVEVFKNSFNSRGFISPISDNAFHYYQYKMLGTFFENDHMIHSIKVIPRRKYEPLFSGTINISDEDWHIQSFELVLTKEAQLEVIDSLKISQIHLPLQQGVWNTQNQLLHFNIKMFSIDATGDFLTIYNDYITHPTFTKKTFDKIIIEYDTAVNKRSSQYWDTIRPVPLESIEMKDYQVKDSLFKVRQDSSYWANNIDSLKKRQGKLKLYKVIYSGINRTHYSKTNPYKWSIETLLTNTGYNLAEGFVMELKGQFEKKIWNKKYQLFIDPTIRYGFVNTHLNPSVDVEIKKLTHSGDKNNRSSWKISVGKKVTQYNSENPINPLANSFTTLWFGRNEMKTYEKEYLSLTFNKKFEDGIRFSLKAEYANRIPTFNSTRFIFRKRDTVNITENYPVDKVSISEVSNHQALLVGFKFSFKPGQRFIKFPHQKISVGSNYPTFTFNYTKGISQWLGSEVDFDKWSLEIMDDRNLKIGGVLKYNFTIGGFLNNKKVFIQDYKHFNSNSVKLSSAYVIGYRLLSSYASSNTAQFVSEAHLEHHFNGMLTNKIPLLNKLNWNMVVGTNSYYIKRNDYYIEYFVGLENIFKLLRVDFVSGYMNGHYYNSSIVLGTGGLLGDGLNKSANDNRSSVSVSF